MRQDLDAQVRLQNVFDVKCLKFSMVRTTLFVEFSSPRYLVHKVDLTVRVRVWVGTDIHTKVMVVFDSIVEHAQTGPSFVF